MPNDDEAQKQLTSEQATVQGRAIVVNLSLNQKVKEEV
jgi:hypothetical protein